MGSIEMRKDLVKWLTVGLALVGVLTQVGVLPPAAVPLAVALGEALPALVGV